MGREATKTANAEVATDANGRKGKTGNGNNERNVRDVFAMGAMEEQAMAKANA